MKIGAVGGGVRNNRTVRNFNFFCHKPAVRLLFQSKEGQLPFIIYSICNQIASEHIILNNFLRILHFSPINSDHIEIKFGVINFQSFFRPIKTIIFPQINGDPNSMKNQFMGFRGTGPFSYISPRNGSAPRGVKMKSKDRQTNSGILFQKKSPIL